MHIISIIFCTVILIIGVTTAYFTQSGVGDTGNIRYEWYYTPVGGTRRKCAEHENKAGETVPAFGFIDDKYYEETTATTAVLSDNYYIDPDKCVHCKMCMTAKYLDGGCMMDKYLRTK